MALVSTSQPGSVGLEVVPGPGGGLFLSLHTTAGHLMVLLTSKEAHTAVQIMHSTLMSHREPDRAPSGESGPSGHLPPPR